MRSYVVVTFALGTKTASKVPANATGTSAQSHASTTSIGRAFKGFRFKIPVEWTAPKSSTPPDSSSKSDDEDVIAKIDEAINDMKQCAAEGAAFLGKTEQDVENQQDVKEQNEEKQEAQKPLSFIKPPKSQKTGKKRIASKDEYKELIKGKQEEKITPVLS